MEYKDPLLILKVTLALAQESHRLRFEFPSATYLLCDLGQVCSYF